MAAHIHHVRRWLVLSTLAVTAAIAALTTVEATAADASTPAGPPRPVTIAEVKRLLPDVIGELARVDCHSRRDTFGAIDVRRTTAEYGTPDDPRHATIMVADFTTMPGVAARLAEGWSGRPIDQSTSSGYRRAYVLDGCPVLEELDRASGLGELKILVRSRLILTLNTDGVDESLLRTTAERVVREGFGTLGER